MTDKTYPCEIRTADNKPCSHPATHTVEILPAGFQYPFSVFTCDECLLAVVCAFTNADHITIKRIDEGSSE